MAFQILNNDVTFNINQSRIFSTDIDILVAGIGGSGVVSGCAVTAQGSPDMTLAVASGSVIIAGTTATVTGANVTITTANATNPRIDLVVVDNSGALSVTAGTAAVNPAVPAIPASSIVLAMVYVPAGDTAIQTNQITDKRITVPGGGTGDWVKLSQITTSASQASADFTSISAAYSALKVLWQAQDTHTGTSIQDLFLKINNDGTSGNYTATSRIGSQNGGAFASTNAASANGVSIGSIPQAGNTSIIASGEVTLVGYAGTTFHKRIVSLCATDDGTNNGTVYNSGARWKSTAAISRLTFIPAGTAFTDGSQFTLYGLK